ncbi:MAG: RDD family protein [Ferruginibacter sp.]
MSTVRINTAFNVALDFTVAPFHKRLFAYIIDFTLLVIWLFAMKYLLYESLGLSIRNNMGFDILVISIPMLFYSIVTELLMNGQTVGKKLMKIRVISLEGGEPTAGQFILRWITKFFEWPFLFGYIYASAYLLIAYVFFTGFLGIAVVIIILISKNSQRLGDMAAGTVVVDAKSFMSVHDTIFMNVNKDNYVVSFPEVMRLSDNDINTVKNVLTQARKTNNTEICMRVEYKVKEVLGISSKLSAADFLEKLLEDYNFLATKE